MVRSTALKLLSLHVALFFRALALASPDEGLRCLERTIGTCTKEQLLEFKEGRREVIYSLEHMALYRELFQSVARLLLRLGEAENETWNNNASGVFKDLFTLGPGRVASTSAPPEERLPILVEAFESDSPETRKLALDVCEKALEATNFTKFGGFDEAGLRKGPAGWTPKTYAGWWEARSGPVWLDSMFHSLSGASRCSAYAAVRRAGRLLKYTPSGV